MVESIGEFSSRGGIFDFYSPSQRHPVRIEFFGDEIDSIRTFDIETQRSVQSLDEITIYPARDIYLDREQFDKVASRIIKDYNERIEELMQFPNDNSEAIDNLLRRKEEVSDHIKTLASMSLMENYIQYFYDNTSFLWDYVNPKSGTILIEEPDKVEEYIEAQDKENKREFDSYYRTGRAVMSEAGLLVGLDDFLNIYSDDRVDRGYSGDRGHQIDTLGIIMPFAKKIDQIKEYTKIEDVKVRLTENYGGRMDRFAAGVTKYLGSGYRVSIVIGDETKLNSIKEFLKENNIPDQNIEFLIGNISRGSEFYEEKLVYISEFDIFGKTKTVKRRKASSKEKAVFFSELKPGDYIVHENHGIGLFKGMEQVVVEGEKKDYLLIQYAGTDRLFVPVDQMGFLQKYVGAEGIKPKINKLSGGDWKATKAKAKLAIAEMTGQLLELYAKRQGRKGYAFGPDSPWQRDFEDSFPLQKPKINS